SGIKQLFCTDVAKDGALLGPAAELYQNIMNKFPELHFIASGGVSSLDDVLLLQDIGCKGVIIGKAIYEQRITLKDLIKLTK
ncbi:MAG: HisA/HisF-related TIM barrel protein, partial [Chitinophagaceae bacterium]